MDKKRIKTLIVVNAIILLSECVSASGMATAVKGIWKGLKIVPFLIAEAIAEAFKQISKWWIWLTAKTAIGFFEAIFENMEYLITLNPPMGEIFPGMLFFMKIIAPFYIFAILFIAIYIIIGSGSARAIAKAKSILGKLVIGLILVTLSPLILQIVLLISENLTKTIMSGGAGLGISAMKNASSNLFGKFTWLCIIHREGGLEVFTFNSVMLTGLITMLFLRQVMVVLFGMLVPLSLVMYSFYPTKNVGKDLLVQAFLWAFTPVAWALSLVIIGSVISSIPTYVPEFYISLGAFFFFIGSPMLIMGVGDWLANLVFMFELLQAAPLSIAAVVLDETLK